MLSGVQLRLKAGLTAGCTISRHASLDRRLDVVGAPPILTQHSTPFKLFLEPTQGAVN
jgi:hypothetical protein